MPTHQARHKQCGRVVTHSFRVAPFGACRDETCPGAWHRPRGSTPDVSWCLELLSQCVEAAPADEGGAELEEGEVELVASLPAGGEPSQRGQPGERALDHAALAGLLVRMPRGLPRPLPRPTNTAELTAYTEFRTLPRSRGRPAPPGRRRL